MGIILLNFFGFCKIKKKEKENYFFVFLNVFMVGMVLLFFVFYFVCFDNIIIIIIIRYFKVEGNVIVLLFFYVWDLFEVE